ncbi:putative replication protein [[Clostridium] sordellii]|nr:putative replication protein [[Clostridium] sordellii] [Paeniclostridium sordellii]
MLELLHFNNTGYFSLNTKSDRLYTRFLKDIPDYNLVMNYLSLQDLYVSLNSFYVPKRKIACVRQINCFGIDIDYYKIPKYKNKTCSEMINIMRADGMFSDLEPSFYEDSGQGLYIFYLIYDIPKQCIKTWNKTEKKLLEKFEKYGADKNAKDLARVLRLAGSINSKTGKRARLILPKQEPVRYKLREITDIILPTLPYTKEEWLKLKKERKKKKAEYKKQWEERVNKISYIFNPHSLNYKRMNDIQKLIELRANSIDGIRNTAFHLYSLFAFYTYGTTEHEKVWNNLKDLNNSLTEPLQEQELLDIYNSSKEQGLNYEKILNEYNTNHLKENKVKYLRQNGCYIYSNQSIIDKLQITENEMEKLNILIDYDEKLNRKRAKYQENKDTINKIRREKYQEKLKKQGKMSKKEQLQIIYEKIKSLRMEGLKNNDIAQALSLPTKTLKRHITYMNKNGLF